MYCLIITTCSKEDEEKIKEALLKDNLVACINSFEVTSTYIWKGKIEDARERMLFIKTKKERWEEVKKKIKELHSYELPEIICIEFDGSDEYLKWINSVVK